MNGKVTKAELVDALRSTEDLNRMQVRTFIDTLLEELKEAILAGKTVELRGFGTFKVKMHKGRKRARNPRTGEIVSVEDHGMAIFRPGRELKKAAWSIKPE
ncbi:MAG: HU family DNA-binding protein [Rectinemataceae bacterium]